MEFYYVAHFWQSICLAVSAVGLPYMDYISLGISRALGFSLGYGSAILSGAFK